MNNNCKYNIHQKNFNENCFVQRGISTNGENYFFYKISRSIFKLNTLR